MRVDYLFLITSTKTAIMYHSDLREEIKFLKARLLYKTKKLNEAKLANIDPEMQSILQHEVKELEEKLNLCQTEADAQAESENEENNKSD